MNAKLTQLTSTTAHRICADSNLWNAALDAQNALALMYSADSLGLLEAYAEQVIYAAALMRYALRTARAREAAARRAA